jgi:hypothetical protein
MPSLFLLIYVGQASFAPDVEVLNVATGFPDDLEEAFETGSDSTLIDVWVENDHQFVIVHGYPTSFGLTVTGFLQQEG